MRKKEQSAALPSRRTLLKSAALLGAGAAFLDPAEVQGQSDATAALGERLLRANRDANRRILIRGGSILSVDRGVGNLATGDLLIEGTRIAQVGPDLSAAARNAIVVDATGGVLIPGFVDPHLHAWQGQLSGIMPLQATDPTREYFALMHQTFGPKYRPEDIYIGNLLTMLSALNGGITTVCDNSHNNRSTAHADAAIQGLRDSGARAVHAAGGIRFPEQPWDGQWPRDMTRLRKQFSSDDQLVTLRMFSGGTINLEAMKVARDLDLWVSFDGSGDVTIPDLYAKKLLVGKESFNHGGMPDANWKAVQEHGAKVNVCPRNDYPGTPQNLHNALRHGIRPGLSQDNPVTRRPNMFAEMQTLYVTDRGFVTQMQGRKDPNAPMSYVTPLDVLEFATIRGAECAATDRVSGSLTPGKEADVVLVRSGGPQFESSNNAISAVVQAGEPGSVEAVWVAGQLRKWDRTLVGYDLRKIHQEGNASRDYLFKAVGRQFDRLFQ
jgi:cytosine/adenosine deaminase-related metal-dependent hydrolase